MFDVFAPGTMLGRYDLLATIGEGGMARVILARRRGPAGFEKVCVVKVIHPRMSDDQAAVGMLLDEARVAAQINHQNVVQTYELGETHGTFYIVMEYLAGESLHRLLKVAAMGPSLDPRMAARIVADAADGLHAAHELQDVHGRHVGVIHRDVSPGNIVVLYNGNVKVVDFGIAKTQDRVSSTTALGQLKGKYAYMSPEQIRNEPLDRRSDVFSLGVVLWECLALRRLFHADNSAAILMQVLSSDRIAPSIYRPEIPQALDDVTLKALSVDPRDRYQTAAEMKRAIEDAIWQSRCDTSDIEMYMTAVFGDRILKRRALLASAARESVPQLELEQSVHATFENTNGLATPKPEPMPPPQKSRWLRRTMVVASILGAIGVGLALRKSDDHAEAARLVTPPPTPAPVPAPVVKPRPPTVATVAPPPVAPPPVQTEEVATSDLRGEHDQPTRVAIESTRTTEGPSRPSSSRRDQRASGSTKELYARATQLYLEGNLAEAETLFRQLAASGYAPAHRGLGFIYQRTGATAKALAELRRYLALVPDASDAASITSRIEQLGGQP
jgi:serine/threonine-protein kinase